MATKLFDKTAIHGTREAIGFITNILESSTQYSIVGMDLDGKILLWNEGARRIYGYEPEEIVGKKAEILYNSEDVAARKPQEIMQIVLQRGKWEGVLNRVRKNGQRFTAHMMITPRCGIDGQPNGFLAISKDISDEIHLTEELKAAQLYTRSLIESNIDALMTTDPLGIISDVNLQMCEMTGYSRAELIGSPFKEYFTDHMRAEDGIRQVLAEDRVTNYELTMQARNGKLTIVSYNATTFRDAEGNLQGVFAAARDITAQKVLEEQLQHKNEELEVQYRRIQEVNRLKSEFLANMSHELRTPLNGIIGFSKLLYNETVGPISVEQKEYLGDILSSSKHLLQLINDVLDLAKVEAGKTIFAPEKVDLKKLVHEVRDVLLPLAAGKRLHMKSTIDPHLIEVVIDPGRFKQVLYNYLSNAIKFTMDEGHIEIRLIPEGTATFRLEVEDDGPGIKAEDRGQLFVEFQQLDMSTAKQYQGTGLGLALTKRLIEAQGGNVGVRSTPGEGSTFYAVLPQISNTSEDDKQEDILEPLIIPDANAPSVLVIEDDPNDQNWLKRTFLREGFQVETAITGKQAVSLCQERLFDLVTLDLLLPDTGGWKVLEQIRSGGPNIDVPIVVITVVGEKAIGFGFPISEVLHKPVKLEELLAVLKRIGMEGRQPEPVAEAMVSSSKTLSTKEKC